MDCLVTRLKGSVSDDSLPYLGEVFIEYETGIKSIRLNPIAGETVPVRIIGDGNFTNSTGGTNLGKEIILNNIEGGNLLYLSDSVTKIGIRNRDKLLSINMTEKVLSPLSVLSYMTGLTYVYFHGYGDANAIKGSLPNVSYNWSFGDKTMMNTETLVRVFPNLGGLVTNGRVGYIDGALSYITNKYTYMYTLNISNSKIVGNVSDFASMPRITDISIYGCKSIVGNIDTLSTIGTLTRLSAGNSGVTGGDASKLPPLVDQLKTEGLNVVFSWKTTRPSSAYIIATNGTNFGNDLDAFLINQANCKANIAAHSGDASYSTISATGTRTTASDSAIATLRSKGYTVTVPSV